jgi:hypothetical protein
MPARRALLIFLILLTLRMTAREGETPLLPARPAAPMPGGEPPRALRQSSGCICPWSPVRGRRLLPGWISGWSSSPQRSGRPTRTGSIAPGDWAPGGTAGRSTGAGWRSRRASIGGLPSTPPSGTLWPRASRSPSSSSAPRAFMRPEASPFDRLWAAPSCAVRRRAHPGRPSPLPRRAPGRPLRSHLHRQHGPARAGQDHQPGEPLVSLDHCLNWPYNCGRI